MKRLLNRLFPATEGWLPYLYLFNTALPLYFMLQEPLEALVPGLLLFAVLLVVYRQVYWSSPSIAAVWIAAALADLFILAWFYHPLYVYVIFLFAYSFVRLSSRDMAIASGIFAAGWLWLVVDTGYIRELQLLLLMLPAFFGGVILPFLIRVSMRYRAMAEKLRQALQEKERLAHESERHRIAQELHDTLGHTLSLIALKSELVKKLLPRSPDQATREAEDIHDTARAALKQMRELVTEMRTVRLSDEFVHARQLCAAAGIKLQTEPLELKLTPLQESILAMCLREAVTNVVRHSRAAHCSVRWLYTRGALKLMIQDDGVGMDENRQRSSAHWGSGMIGMTKRLQMIEGTLHIHSQPRQGTELVLEIPSVVRHAAKKEVIS